jgi:hypothetical protein
MTQFFIPVPKPEKSEKKERKMLKRVPCKKLGSAEKRARKFRLHYHSKQYVLYIHAMPCAECGVEGYSEAAHVISRGAGGEAKHLVPLCRNRFDIVGCHPTFDERRWELPEGIKKRMLDLASRLWALFHLGGNS